MNENGASLQTGGGEAGGGGGGGGEMGVFFVVFVFCFFVIFILIFNHDWPSSTAAGQFHLGNAICSSM